MQLIEPVDYCRTIAGDSQDFIDWLFEKYLQEYEQEELLKEYEES